MSGGRRSGGGAARVGGALLAAGLALVGGDRALTWGRRGTAPEPQATSGPGALWSASVAGAAGLLDGEAGISLQRRRPAIAPAALAATIRMIQADDTLPAGLGGNGDELRGVVVRRWASPSGGPRCVAERWTLRLGGAVADEAEISVCESVDGAGLDLWRGAPVAGAEPDAVLRPWHLPARYRWMLPLTDARAMRWQTDCRLPPPAGVRLPDAYARTRCPGR